MGPRAKSEINICLPYTLFLQAETDVCHKPACLLCTIPVCRDCHMSPITLCLLAETDICLLCTTPVGRDCCMSYVRMSPMHCACRQKRVFIQYSNGPTLLLQAENRVLALEKSFNVLECLQTPGNGIGSSHPGAEWEQHTL